MAQGVEQAWELSWLPKAIVQKAVSSAQARMAARKAKELVRRKSALDIGGLPMAHWLEGASLVEMCVARHGAGNWDLALSVTEYGG